MPEEKARVPDTRFEGFSGEWMQQKAGELFVSVSDKGHSGLPVLSATQERGMVRRDEAGITVLHDEKNETGYKRVLPGQFVIHLRSFQGGFAHSPIEGITSPAYTVLAFKSPREHDDYFWKYVFSSESFVKRLGRITYGIRDGRSISYSEFLQMDFLFPPKEEQQKIGSFFARLDRLIALQRRKTEKLASAKKAFLSKMFPKEGERAPETRFEGFAGEWEMRRLGEIASFSRGRGYSKADLRRSGTPIILYGRLYTRHEIVISDVDTFAEPKEGSVYSRGGEVIVPASGETAEDIAIASAVEKPGVLLGSDLNIIRPRGGLDPAFVAISISRGKPRADMARLAQGKSIVHLHNSDLQKIELFYPSLPEQQKIGSFFARLDRLIALQRRKTEKLIALKKGFLQKMFVS